VSYARPGCWAFDRERTIASFYLARVGRVALFGVSDDGVELLFGGWRGPCVRLSPDERESWLSELEVLSERWDERSRPPAAGTEFVQVTWGVHRGSLALSLEDLTESEDAALRSLVCLAHAAYPRLASTALYGAVPEFAQRADFPEGCESRAGGERR
jgi:hypothetical protein